MSGIRWSFDTDLRRHVLDAITAPTGASQRLDLGDRVSVWVSIERTVDLVTIDTAADAAGPPALSARDLSIVAALVGDESAAMIAAHDGRTSIEARELPVDVDAAPRREAFARSVWGDASATVDPRLATTSPAANLPAVVSTDIERFTTGAPAIVDSRPDPEGGTVVVARVWLPDDNDPGWVVDVRSPALVEWHDRTGELVIRVATRTPIDTELWVRVEDSDRRLIALSPFDSTGESNAVVALPDADVSRLRFRISPNPLEDPVDEDLDTRGRLARLTIVAGEALAAGDMETAAAAYDAAARLADTLRERELGDRLRAERDRHRRPASPRTTRRRQGWIITGVIAVVLCAIAVAVAIALRNDAPSDDGSSPVGTDTSGGVVATDPTLPPATSVTVPPTTVPPATSPPATDPPASVVPQRSLAVYRSDRPSDVSLDTIAQSVEMLLLDEVVRPGAPVRLQVRLVLDQLTAYPPGGYDACVAGIGRPNSFGPFTRLVSLAAVIGDGAHPDASRLDAYDAGAESPVAVGVATPQGPLAAELVASTPIDCSPADDSGAGALTVRNVYDAGEVTLEMPLVSPGRYTIVPLFDGLDPPTSSDGIITVDVD